MNYDNILKTSNEGTLRFLSSIVENSKGINPSLYSKYDVKRGLRDISGQGVMAGLTEISEVSAYIIKDNEYIPTPGKLFYRGVNVDKIVKGFLRDNRLGFEEVSYLLLFGYLPTASELENYKMVQSEYCSLPKSFVREQMMKTRSQDIMNLLSRSVLTLYNYDKQADDTSLSNVLRQSLQLIAQFPLLAAYGYQSCAYCFKNESLVIHNPKPEYTTAENFLHMLRPNSDFTALEARLLDLILVLHAEHGGGNNSSFVMHAVTSSGTDTYSSVAAALSSLKGPRHGGANVKVVQMFQDIKNNIRDWADEVEIRKYLKKLLRKEAFDRSGLIYGIGHAVYSISDPRTVQLKEQAQKLAQDKGMEAEFALHSLVEELAPEVIAEERKIYKGVSANVDFYSGFVYQMLDVPVELFTPLFAVARIVGWSAHRLEELKNNGKIIRPAYKGIAPHRRYIPIQDRG